MTLPASYPLSMSQINTELGRATNATTSLLESAVRTLAQRPSGSVSFSDLLGKSSLTATGVNDERFYVSSSAGTASAYPSVNVTGGVTPYTYSWSFTSNPSGCGMSNSTSQTPTISKNFTAGSTGGFSATLQCVVTDNAGTQRTVTGVSATANWEP